MAESAGFFPHVRYTNQDRDSGHNQTPRPREHSRENSHGDSRDDSGRHRQRSVERPSTPRRYDRRPQSRDYSERRHHDDDRRHQGRRGPNGGRVLSMAAPSWSWVPMIVSITSMTVFVSVFGVIGLAFSSFAYSDHKVGDYARSRYKLRWAWFCSILGIVFTTCCIIMLIITMFSIDVPKPTFKNYQYWIPPWLLEKLLDK